jgi:hypothetical protein
MKLFSEKLEKNKTSLFFVRLKKSLTYFYDGFSSNFFSWNKNENILGFLSRSGHTHRTRPLTYGDRSDKGL